MPASARRAQPAPAPAARGKALLTTLFWAGVGLTPAAALLLLLGQAGGPLRVGAVLALLAVVLIGLSITLRRDASADLVNKLLDEFEVLREDVRADVAARFSASQRGFSERLQVLQQNVEALRGELAASGAMASAGVPHVGRAAVARGAIPSQRPAGSVVAASVVAADVVGADDVAAAARGAGRGVVRHTETVHVTTRHTVVDHAADSQNGSSTYRAGTDRRLGAEPTPVAAWHGDRLADSATGRHGQQSREFRIGERRTALHASETGAQMRVDDRWASMREESYAADSRYEPAWGREQDQRRGLGWEVRSDWERQPSWQRQSDWEQHPGQDDGHGSQAWRVPPARQDSADEPSVAWLRDLRGAHRHQPEPVSFGGHRQRDEPDDERFGPGYGYGYGYGSEHRPRH